MTQIKLSQSNPNCCLIYQKIKRSFSYWRNCVIYFRGKFRFKKYSFLSATDFDEQLNHTLGIFEGNTV